MITKNISNNKINQFKIHRIPRDQITKETLGDAILTCVITSYIFKTGSQYTYGERFFWLFCVHREQCRTRKDAQPQIQISIAENSKPQTIREMSYTPHILTSRSSYCCCSRLHALHSASQEESFTPSHSDISSRVGPATTPPPPHHPPRAFSPEPEVRFRS
jgi:hypothetical protein